MEFMMGGIIMFGGNYAPARWAFCNGQILPISQNQGLFAILGTSWNGDGRTTFGLPDLRGRVPVGPGQSPGSDDIALAEKKGLSSTQLLVSQMPSHIHTATFHPLGGSSSSLTADVTVNAHNGVGNENNAKGNYWATPGTQFDTTPNSFSKTSDTMMATDAVTVKLSGSAGGITDGTVSVGATGMGNSFSIMQPYLGIYHIIAMEGSFPSRN